MVEADRPKSIAEKISEFLARPPQPVLRFYGGISQAEAGDIRRQILFSVRNGLPLPLFYGIYAEVWYNGFIDYAEKTDHIGPFSIDNWRLTIDKSPAQVEIRTGLVPFEILTDKVQIAVGEDAYEGDIP